MAKRMIQFVLANEAEGFVKVTNLDNASDKFEFNLAEALPTIWLEWKNLDEIEQYTILYGLRQTLSDGGASEKEAAGKLALVRKKYNKVYVERTLRARDSGVEKVKMSDVREKAKALSPEELEQAKALMAKLGINL